MFMGKVVKKDKATKEDKVVKNKKECKLIGFFRSRKNRTTSEDYVFLNRPIDKKEEDRIGISTYVDKLDAAIEAGAQIVAVTSDFGTGKSSLISCYEQRCKHNKGSKKSKKKKVVHVNMWGDYARIKGGKDQGHILPVELHKAFIYQVVSQVNRINKRKKSNYISKRLSKDFGVLFVGGKNGISTFFAVLSVIGLITTAMVNKYQQYVQELLDIGDQTLRKWLIVLFVASVLILAVAIANSEIIFSSKKSEGNRTFDENVLIDLFKQEVLYWHPLKRFVIVIEDLDRIDDKETVMHFLRELRKYYLADDSNGKVTFVVCIKPEALLREDNNAETSDKAVTEENPSVLDNHYGEKKQITQEYKKIFDYTLNLQKVNIDNFDAILRGLLEEKKKWIDKLKIQTEGGNSGMAWMIHGKNIDIREVKSRLNEALTLYESLLSRFPDDAKKKVITFEKCAIATYLRREYENDFYLLEDDALDVLISQYVINKTKTIDDIRQSEKWRQFSPKFMEELESLIVSKKIDVNYRLYFYNYPSKSKLYNISEMTVYNSVIYREAPSDGEEYKAHLASIQEEVIQEAFKKVSSLGLVMPIFILDFDKLFVLLYKTAPDKFFEMITTQRYDKPNTEKACNLIEKCIVEREGNYNRDKLITELSERLNYSVEDKTVLCAIRLRMCVAIPNEVLLLKSLFMGDNPFISEEEVEAIDNADILLQLANYETLTEGTTSVYNIHDYLIGNKGWNGEKTKFYLEVTNRQGVGNWKDELAEVCTSYGSIPDEIAEIYSNAIEEEEITVGDYVSCVEQVENLSKANLKILSANMWIGGLSKRLCDLLYSFKMYLEYVCNISQLEKVIIHYDDDNVCAAIRKNAEWIQEQSEIVFSAIRKGVLRKRAWVIMYKFLFEDPYPVLEENELNEISNAEDAIEILNERAILKDQCEMIVNYFNRKLRKPTAIYRGILLIIAQKPDIAKEMFYGLDFAQIPYADLSKKRINELSEELYALFGMDKKPVERVKFLKHTRVPSEIVEVDLCGELNKDDSLMQDYVKYANGLSEVPEYTIDNIIGLKSIYTYGPKINQKLYERKAYAIYIASKTSYDKAFKVEDDKIDELWPVYVKMFNSSSYARTTNYMKNNLLFMNEMIDKKEYLSSGEFILNYSAGRQSVELLNYVVENYDEETQIHYFMQINGFQEKTAARRFCEIARDYRYIGENAGVYENVKGTLIDIGLERWLTRIHNNSL